MAPTPPQLLQVRDREQYNILFDHHHTYSPSSPPRSPSLFTPLLRSVIGPTSPRCEHIFMGSPQLTVPVIRALPLLFSVCRDTVDLPRHNYTSPHFHSTPSHPLPHPLHFSVPSHQPALYGSSPSRPISSHDSKVTSTAAHSWTFLAARGGSVTQDYGQEKPRVPLQHSSWDHHSQHGAPSNHHSLHHPQTAKSWSSRGVQTSSTKADPSSVVSRQWPENFELDHKVNG